MEEGTGTGVKWKLLHCVAELRLAELQFQTVSDIRGGSSQAGYGNAGRATGLGSGWFDSNSPSCLFCFSFFFCVDAFAVAGGGDAAADADFLDLSAKSSTVILQTMIDAMI